MTAPDHGYRGYIGVIGDNEKNTETGYYASSTMALSKLLRHASPLQDFSV